MPIGRTRFLALGGVVGPVAFVSAWVAGAASTDRPYSSVDDAISRLAAVGADTRPLMTAGMVTFGLALPAYAVALRSALPGRAWISAAATGVATLGVAALPLDRSEAVDRLHGLAAAVGYATLALTPLLAARPLRESGHRAYSNAGVAAASVSSAALVVSLLVDANGLFQRIGLTATDAWIVASAPLLFSARPVR